MLVLEMASFSPWLAPSPALAIKELMPSSQTKKCGARREVAVAVQNTPLIFGRAALKTNEKCVLPAMSKQEIKAAGC